MNPLLHGNVADKRPMDPVFFRQVPVLPMEGLAKLKFQDIHRGNSLPLNAVNGNLNLNLTFLTYLRLTGACGSYVTGLKNSRENNGTSLDLRDFFVSFKKGSAPVRRFLSSKKKIPIVQTQAVKTFFRLIQFENLDDTRIRPLFSLWGEAALPNHFREFLFKFYNNILGLNTRVSHFVQNHDRNCTFCIQQGKQNDESFRHFFLSCEVAKPIRRKFIDKFFYDLNMNEEMECYFWFGIVPEGVPDKKLYSLCVLFIQFGFWTAKLKKKLPSYNKIITDTLFNLKVVLKLKKSFYSENNDYSLSRNLQIYLQHGLH
jgi:hypothetical protein